MSHHNLSPSFATLAVAADPSSITVMSAPHSASTAAPSSDSGLITITAPGITVKLIALGARITHLLVKDKKGLERDVVVGHDDPEEYEKEVREKKVGYWGCVVG